ncbi:uncharacterized protein LOC131148804 [Malania oleifera]|uniref:uncharacterized protein LOC131148804 n=1 Tax=Malania oleifera TaxID=397392 RepID=UPI0025ADA573|nr:uncharacterized protein LOC131148804 [Malania oleifera]
MDLRSNSFPGKTLSLKPKTSHWIAETRKHNSKDHPIRSQKRVFGTTRTTNVLVKPAIEKLVKKPPTGLSEKQCDSSEATLSASNNAVIPATESDQRKSPEESQAENPAGDNFEKKPPDNAKAIAPITEVDEKKSPLKMPMAKPVETESAGKIGSQTPRTKAGEEKFPVEAREVIATTEGGENKSFRKITGTNPKADVAGKRSLDKPTKAVPRTDAADEKSVRQTGGRSTRVEAGEKVSVAYTGERVNMDEASEGQKSPKKSRGLTQTNDDASEQKSPDKGRGTISKKSPEKPTARLRKKSVCFPEKAARNRSKNSQEEDKVVPRTPVQSPCTRKGRNSSTPYHSAERCSKCRFDKLETSSYWLVQIKLAETGGKHFASAAFFRLAFESKAEPIHNLRIELKRYLGRHQYLSAAREWREVSVSYGLVKEECSEGKGGRSKTSGSDFGEEEELNEQLAGKFGTEEI